MFKDKVKECRKELGLTQIEFSKKIGISRSYLAEIERGRIKGTVALITKLSEATNKPLSYFIDDENIAINSYDVLDQTIELMINNNEINKEGEMTDWAREMLIKVLEKEIKLKLERMYK